MQFLTKTVFTIFFLGTTILEISQFQTSAFLHGPNIYITCYRVLFNFFLTCTYLNFFFPNFNIMRDIIVYIIKKIDNNFQNIKVVQNFRIYTPEKKLSK